MSKLYYYTMVGLVVLSVLPISKVIAEKDHASFLKGPSFKANLKVSNKNNPRMSQKSDVWKSKHGLRMVGPGPGGQKMVTLTIKDETYMLLPDRRKYISASEIKQQADKNSKEGPMELFAGKPCQGFAKSKKANTTKVAGRKVTKWYCGQSSGLDNTVHYFDESLKLVIKVKKPNGIVMELSNIEEKSLDRKLFEIPSGYQKMTFAQLMMPPGAGLAPFTEANK